MNIPVKIGIDFKGKTTEIEGKRVKLQIWDTAGQEKFRSVIQTYYRGASGILLMYSVNERQSFQNIISWMKQIKTNNAENVVIFLVGNKCDLEDRQVEKEEGEEMAKEHKLVFFETSAKDGTNVNETFYEIARLIKYKIDYAAGRRSTIVVDGGRKSTLGSTTPALPLPQFASSDGLQLQKLTKKDIAKNYDCSC